MISVNFMCPTAVYALKSSEINLHGYDMNYDRPANLSSQLVESFHWKPNCRKILILFDE